MLYLLADIVNKGVNNDDCVMRVKRGDAQQLNKKHAPEKQGKTGPDTTKHVTQNQPKPSGVDTKKDIEDKQEKKFAREKRKVDNISTRKTSTRPKNQEADSESIQATEPKTTPGPTGGTIADCSGRQSVQPQDASVRPDSRNVFTMEGMGEEEARSTESTQPMVRPSSAKGMRSRKEEPATETLPSEEDQQRPIITPNARLAPPRPKRNLDQITEGGGMINGPLGSAVSTLIIPESHHESDDADDDQFVVEETIRDRCNLGPFTFPVDEEDKGDHGGLVSKMLQSKKDFETGNLLPHTKFDLKPVSHIDETARQRERAQVEKEMEKLCAALQSLSRSALPLGKLMDFVQEDLESMQQEYERWTVENQELQIRLRQEESLTQSSIDPLRSQLAELRQQCAEHRKAIASCSAKILTNEERIRDMLSRSVEIVH
ncbi:unnamed protein product [Dicrocoelium dendriticum]|nr:unnamed protein product [Dicrocoelium dendriticum]